MGGGLVGLMVTYYCRKAKYHLPKLPPLLEEYYHYCIFIGMVELYSSVVGQYLMLIMI